MKKNWLAIGAACVVFSFMTACGNGEDGDFTGGSNTGGDTNITGTFYETTITFYVSPQDNTDTPNEQYVYPPVYSQTAMENMIILLESDRFAVDVLDIAETDEEERLKFMEATSFSGGVKEEGALKNSFISVDISVRDDVDYARELRSLLIDAIPDFVERVMPRPNGYDETLCRRVSLMDEIQTVVYRNGIKVE